MNRYKFFPDLGSVRFIPYIKYSFLPISSSSVYPTGVSKDKVKKCFPFFCPTQRRAILSLHLRRYKECFDHQLDPYHSQQMKNYVSLL